MSVLGTDLTPLIAVKMVKAAKASHFLSLDRKLVKRAHAALTALLQQQSNPKDLLDNPHQFLYMTIELNNLPDFFTQRPLQLPLPHPIYTRAFNSRICMIVKDPQRAWKEKLDASGLKQTALSKVVSIEKLGKKYGQFKDRRALLREFDLFLADVRVFRMLPERTGKDFYRTKKTPVLLDLEADFENSVRTALNSTYIVLGHGPIYNVKVARTTQSASEVYDNMVSALDGLQRVLPELQPAHIRRIDLKGATTLSLPVHNYLTETEVQALG